MGFVVKHELASHILAAVHKCLPRVEAYADDERAVRKVAVLALRLIDEVRVLGAQEFLNVVEDVLVVRFEHHVVEIRDHLRRINACSVTLETRAVVGGEDLLRVVDNRIRRAMRLHRDLRNLRHIHHVVADGGTAKPHQRRDANNRCDLAQIRHTKKF